MTSEEAAELSLEQIKKLIEEEIPNAFPKKKTKAKSNGKKQLYIFCIKKGLK